MPKFLVTYHGAGAPAPEEAQQAMAAFMAWASSAGEALIDPGAPLGPARTVSAGSVSDGPADGPAERLLDRAGRRPGQRSGPGQEPPVHQPRRLAAGQHGGAARLTVANTRPSKIVLGRGRLPAILVVVSGIRGPWITRSGRDHGG